VYNKWVKAKYSSEWCSDNFIQHRSMRRARDVREKLVDLLDRVEVEMKSNENDTTVIGKAVVAGYFLHAVKLEKKEP
jgi:pre-mRNA-splicing factor ATP-dependent RNA helicase DHX16